ncbi:MAG: HAD family phosphatase [Anaerolineales bacterium]|jgi:HAD superfamily hydrolase (TIGR01509 family)
MTIKAFIFDLDGVIVLSEPLGLRAWRKWLEPYGKTLSEAEYDNLIGRQARASAEWVIRRTGVPASVEQALRSRPALLASVVDETLQPRPGIFGLLEALQARRLLLGVASNSFREYVERVLAVMGLSERFACVCTHEDVSHSKPAPDLYLAAARCLGVPPAQCLVVEDSPTGLQAAVAAGMRTVAVPNERLRAQDFSAASAFFASLGELTANLDALLAL